MSYDAGSASQPFGRSSASGVYPATVRQLLSAKQQHLESSFFLDGIEVIKVTCVASIVNIREYPSMKSYLLEDGSGRLSMVLSRSLKSEIDPLLEEALKENVYVRVIGQLKAFNGINELNATHIRLVHDMHEPFFHCLEAMVVFLSNQRTSQSAPRAQPTSTAPEVSQSSPSMQRPAIRTEEGIEDNLAAQEQGPDFDTTLERIDGLTLVDHHSDGETEFVQQSSPPPESPSRSPSSSLSDPSLETRNWSSLRPDPYSSLSPLQRDIIIRMHDNVPYFPNGVPIRMLYGRNGPYTARESEIRQAIEEMMDDGLVYSTVDQNHFKMVD